MQNSRRKQKTTLRVWARKNKRLFIFLLIVLLVPVAVWFSVGALKENAKNVNDSEFRQLLKGPVKQYIERGVYSEDSTAYYLNKSLSYEASSRVDSDPETFEILQTLIRIQHGNYDLHSKLPVNSSDTLARVNTYLHSGGWAEDSLKYYLDLMEGMNSSHTGSWKFVHDTLEANYQFAHYLTQRWLTRTTDGVDSHTLTALCKTPHLALTSSQVKVLQEMTEPNNSTLFKQFHADYSARFAQMSFAEVAKAWEELLASTLSNNQAD